MVFAFLIGLTALLAAFVHLRRANQRMAAQHSGLESLHERSLALLAACPDAVIGTDAEGHITAWNAAAQRWYGPTDGVALGKRLSDVLPWLPWDPTLARGLEPGERLRASVLPPSDPSTGNASGAIECIATPLRDDRGTLTGCCVVLRDVSAYKQAHLELRAARTQRNDRTECEERKRLAELSRMNKELDDFVYVASHDLRSPLRSINSLAGWIIEDDKSVAAKTGERLRQIQSRAARMTQLLDDVMTYARAGKNCELSGPRMSAAALTAEVAASLRVPSGFRIETDAALDRIMVQRMPLEQVLTHLIGNAIKHHDSTHGSVRLWATQEQGRYRFFVADDGPGIAEDYRDVVFEMFATLKPRDSVEGSGMGLPLVRRIVTRLGGSCGIQATTGRGTCLWFDWPAACNELGADRPAPVARLVT
jgi:signal transduction histidine kinase